VAGLEGESSVRIFGKAGDEVFEVRDPGGYSVKCIVVAFRFGMIVVRPVLSIPYPERLRQQFEGVIWRFKTGG
jgi:hypothetical protein